MARASCPGVEVMAANDAVERLLADAEVVFGRTAHASVPSSRAISRHMVKMVVSSVANSVIGSRLSPTTAPTAHSPGSSAGAMKSSRFGGEHRWPNATRRSGHTSCRRRSEAFQRGCRETASRVGCRGARMTKLYLGLRRRAPCSASPSPEMLKDIEIK